MNWFARNLAVILFGAATSVLTAMLFIFLEARTGTPLFGVSFIRLVPLGAIFAGLVGSVGYLGAAQALRLRPGMTDVAAIVAVACGVVFMVQSAEFAFFMSGSTQAAAATRDTVTFLRYVGNAVAHSPLQFWGGGDENDDAASTMYFAGSTGMSRAGGGGGGDSRVDGISQGVGGMMASQDASNSAAVKHVDQLGAGISNVEAKVKSHSSIWALLGMQIIGFATGGMVVFFHLRSLPHCKSCALLLSVKGEKTRYFSRSREMRSAVDEVLVRARDKQLQQSILMHVSKGSEKKQVWSEFCAVLEIRRCMQCKTHRMHFRARRKDGATWKDIALMAYTATTLEPVDFSQDSQ